MADPTLPDHVRALLSSSESGQRLLADIIRFSKPGWPK